MKHVLSLWYRPTVADKTLVKLRNLHRGYRSPYVKGCGWSATSCHVRNKGPWVAEITGLDPRFGLARSFVDAEIDHSEAIDTRECKRCWVLGEGPIYEVKEDTRSGKELRRYFVQWVNGQRKELTREEVAECLRSSDH